MTLADKIRSMTDPELADFITDIILNVRYMTAQKLEKNGIKITILDIPYMTKAAVLENLKKTVEEDNK